MGLGFHTREESAVRNECRENVRKSRGCSASAVAVKAQWGMVCHAAAIALYQYVMVVK